MIAALALLLAVLALGGNLVLLHQLGVLATIVTGIKERL